MLEGIPLRKPSSSQPREVLGYTGLQRSGWIKAAVPVRLRANCIVELVADIAAIGARLRPSCDLTAQLRIWYGPPPRLPSVIEASQRPSMVPTPDPACRRPLVLPWRSVLLCLKRGLGRS